MAGTLFVVATPIGNLEDITLRALRTLREVDLIAAEDTRRTSKLLAHHRIQRPMVSLHAHNEHKEAPRLVARLKSGTSIALVSDAGTPGISDPGELLVRLAHESQIKVTPIPGPSSIAAALSVSGQPASEFVFMGFVPRSGRARQDWMKRLNEETRTAVFFESPHRVSHTAKDLAKLLVERQIIINREMTKMNEEFVISQNIRQLPEIKAMGEFVVVVSPAIKGKSDDSDQADRLVQAIELIGCMTTSCQFEVEIAIDVASRAFDLQTAATKKAWKKHRISENQRQARLS